MFNIWAIFKFDILFGLYDVFESDFNREKFSYNYVGAVY